MGDLNGVFFLKKNLASWYQKENAGNAHNATILKTKKPLLKGKASHESISKLLWHISVPNTTLNASQYAFCTKLTWNHLYITQKRDNESFLINIIYYVLLIG